MPRTIRTRLPIAALVGIALLAGLLAIRFISPASEAQGPHVVALERQTFDSVAEAEDYLGFSIREPEVLPEGWRLATVHGQWLTPELPVADLSYLHPDSSVRFLITQTPVDIGPVEAGGASQAVVVQGQPGVRATQVDNQRYIVYSWRRDGLTVHAGVEISQAMSEEQLLEATESLR